MLAILELFRLNRPYPALAQPPETSDLMHSGLTAVWVPDEHQEAMRNLVRAREDMKNQQRRARQQLNAFVLRCGHSWPSGKSRWTRSHYNWLEKLKCSDPLEQVVLQEYIDAVRKAGERVSEISSRSSLRISEDASTGVGRTAVCPEPRKNCGSIRSPSPKLQGHIFFISSGTSVALHLYIKNGDGRAVRRHSRCPARDRSCAHDPRGCRRRFPRARHSHTQ